MRGTQHLARNVSGKTVGNARVRVLFSVMLTFAVIAVVFFGGLYALKTRQMNVIMDETAFTVAELEKKNLESGAILMGAVAARIKHEERLAEAMGQRRYADLRHFGESDFGRLHDRVGLVRLAFLGPDRKPIDVFGIALQPAAELAPFGAVFPTGLEVRLVLDAAGYLLLDVVAPWEVDGHLAGYIELTQDASKMAEAVRQSTNCDILFLARKDMVDRDAWGKAEKARGRDDSWDRLSGTVAVAQTLKVIPTSLGLLLEEAGQPRRVVVGGEGSGRVLNLAWLPISDAQGNQVGNIVLLRDVTKASEGFRQTILVTAALGLISAILLFILLTAVFDDAEKRQRIRATAHRLQASDGGAQSDEPVDLGVLIQETERQLEREVGRAGLDLRIPAETCIAVTDRLLLRDALHQMVMNAIDAAPDAAVVITLDAEARAGVPGWRVTVTDEGARLAASIDDAGTALAARLGPGRAVGVSLVERIASLLGAAFSAENAAGGGVAVKLWLPSFRPILAEAAEATVGSS